MQRNNPIVVTIIPLRAATIFFADAYFKLDIRVTAKECPPVDMSLEVRKGPRWDQPNVEIL